MMMSDVRIDTSGNQSVRVEFSVRNLMRETRRGMYHGRRTKDLAEN